MTIIAGFVLQLVLWLGGLTAFAWHVYKIGLYKPWKVLAINVVLLVVAAWGFRSACPILAHSLWYGTYIYLAPIMFTILVIAGSSYGAYILYKRKREGLALLVVLVVVIPTVFGLFISGSIQQSRISSIFDFDERSALVDMNPDAVRFTPAQVAFQAINDSFARSETKVLEHYLDPVDVNGGFGYVVPMVPQGSLQELNLKSDGVVVLNDSFAASKTDRIRTIPQPFEYGEGMKYLDNIWRRLYQADLWCDYTEIKYLQLNAENPDEWTIVAPKIKWSLRWGFKFFPLPIIRLPEWAGVTLVHANGKVESLSKKEALNDARLKGKPIFPESLTLTYVEAQRYNQGFWSGWYRHADLIEVPELPGTNQMPFYYPGNDGHDYFVIMVEPDGSSRALFKVFYINVNDGSRSVVGIDRNKNYLGPVMALDHIKAKLQGMTWQNDDGHGGDYRCIEPRPISRGGELFFMATVTSDTYKGISLTAVCNARSQDVIPFRERAEFETWLRIPSDSGQSVDDLQGQDLTLINGLDDFAAIRTLMQRISGDFAEIQRRLEALDKRRQAPSTPFTTP